MSSPAISLLAFTSYSTVYLLQYFNISRKLTISKTHLLYVTLAAVSLHAWVLYNGIDTPLGQNLSLSHLFSLTCWLITLISVAASFTKPVENLLLFVLPMAGFSILLTVFFPGLDILKTQHHPDILIHVLISIGAFSMLALAALQATLLYFQNQNLHNKAAGGMMRLLPPLQTMETFFFQIIKVGFLLLSLTLLSAFLFSGKVWNMHRPQKIILSLLAWSLFGLLLTAHYYSGLRGIQASRWTLIGVGLLTLAYLAGKPIIN